MTTAVRIAGKVFVITAAPTVSVAPALAFTQVNAPDLAPLHLKTCGVSGLGEGAQAPLRRTGFISGL